MNYEPNQGYGFQSCPLFGYYYNLESTFQFYLYILNISISIRSYIILKIMKMQLRNVKTHYHLSEKT